MGPRPDHSPVWFNSIQPRPQNSPFSLAPFIVLFVVTQTLVSDQQVAMLFFQQFRVADGIFPIGTPLLLRPLQSIPLKAHRQAQFRKLNPRNCSQDDDDECNGGDANGLMGLERDVTAM